MKNVSLKSFLSLAMLWIIVLSSQIVEAFRFRSPVKFIINRHFASLSQSTSSRSSAGLHFPEVEENRVERIIHPTITDRARTVTHICSGGTLCTTSVMGGVEGFPFGSYVDYILDEKGWPVLLLNEQSMHTQNIRHSQAVSLFVQLPRGREPTTTNAALSRVTFMGKVEKVPNEEITALKFAFILLHPYAEQIADSNKFSFFRIKPDKIYFSGGFGVMSTWINIPEYEQAKPDVLAHDVPNVLSRVNVERQLELILICKHFLGLDDVDLVRIQTIDRLGVDLRITRGEFTDEYRIGFRHPVNSSEDAKSELMKLFQEAWERDQGYFFAEDLPPIKKYAEDILRK